MLKLSALLFTSLLLPQAFAAVEPITVVLEGTSWCPYCKFFERDLVETHCSASNDSMVKNCVPVMSQIQGLPSTTEVDFELNMHGIQQPVKLLVYQLDRISHSDVEALNARFGETPGYPTFRILGEGQGFVTGVGGQKVEDLLLHLSSRDQK